MMSGWRLVSEKYDSKRYDRFVDSKPRKDAPTRLKYYYAVQKGVAEYLAGYDKAEGRRQRRARKEAHDVVDRISVGVGYEGYKVALDVLDESEREVRYKDLHAVLDPSDVRRMLPVFDKLRDLDGYDEMSVADVVRNLPQLYVLNASDVDVDVDIQEALRTVLSEEARGIKADAEGKWPKRLYAEAQPSGEEDEDAEDDDEGSDDAKASAPGGGEKKDSSDASDDTKGDVKGGTTGTTTLSDLKLDIVEDESSVISKGSFNATTNMKQAFENNLTDLKGDVIQKGLGQVVARMSEVAKANGMPFRITGIEVQCTASTMANRGPAAKLTFKELAQKRGELVKKLIDTSEDLKPPQEMLAEDYKGVSVVTDKYPVTVRGRVWKPNGDGTVGPKTPYQEIEFPQLKRTVNYHLSDTFGVGTGDRPKSNFQSPATESAMLQFKQWIYETPEQLKEIRSKAQGVVLVDDESGQTELRKLVGEMAAFQKSNSEFFQKVVHVVRKKGSMKWMYAVVKALSNPLSEVYEDYITCYVIYRVVGAKADDKVTPQKVETLYVLPCCEVTYVGTQESCKDGICDVASF